MRPDRRAFLALLAFLGPLASLAACNGAGSVPGVGGSNAASTASNPFARVQSRIRSAGKGFCGDYKLKLVNETHLVADKDVYFALWGKTVDGTKGIYLANSNGDVKDATSTGGKQTDEVTNFNLAKTQEFKIPLMIGARFYVSYDKPMYFEINNQGFVRELNGVDKGDRNYSTAWDFLEWNKSSNCDNFSQIAFAPNTSAVDGFTIPMQFHIVGLTPKGQEDVERGAVPGGYSEILQALQANPAFQGLVLSNGSGRIVSPRTAYNANLISHSYYDDYIKKVWTKYEKARLLMTYDLTCNGQAVRRASLEGKVENGQMVFSQTGSACLQLKPIAFRMPTTEDVFKGLIQDDCVSGCHGGEADQQRNVANQIGTALNAAFFRSTLMHTTTISNASPPYSFAQDSDYCKQKDAVFYDADVTNVYGKYVHEYAVHNLAYASSVDEVCDQSALVHFTVPGLKDEPNQVPFTVTLVKR